GAVASERGESDLYLAAVARVHDFELDMGGGGRRCEILDEVLGGRGVRIAQRPKMSRRGKKLTQQAQSLCHQLTHERVHAGGVAARPTETGDETEFDRVVSDVKDDGSAISGQLGEAVVLPLSIAILDCYVLVFDVAHFGQGSENYRPICP